MSPVPMSNTQFYLHIDGLPSGYTWQDLKDLVRSVASRGIWTNVGLSPTGPTGGVRVPLANEAYNLYVHLCDNGIEGRRVRVALWDISNSPARFLRGNANQDYNSQWPAVSGMLQDRTMWSPVPGQSYAGARPAPQANIYSPPTTIPMTPPNGAFPQMNQTPSPQHYVPRVMQNAQYAQVILPTEPPIPPMMFDTQRLPINGTNGVVTTETRGVLVRNLHFLLTQADVRAKFGRIGVVVHCIVSKDTSGRSRGSATVKFSTLNEARLAVDTFDGCDWRDRTLQVRLLREGEAVQQPREPVIANGTTGVRGTQRGLRGGLRA